MEENYTCTSCNTPVSKTAKFCPECGEKFQPVIKKSRSKPYIYDPEKDEMRIAGLKKNQTERNRAKLGYFILIIISITIAIAWSSFDTSSNNFSNIEQSSESKPATQTKPDKIEVAFIAERQQAVNLLWEYKLQKDTVNFKKDTPLKNVFEELVAESLARPSPGWISLKDGDRVVVVWKGVITTFPKVFQWQIKNNQIIALNGSALSYTPELEENFEAKIDANSTAVWNRFDEIMKTTVQPEFNKRSDDAIDKGLDLSIVNDWYDKAEKEATIKVGKEFNLTYEQTFELLSKHAWAVADQSSEFANSRGKILSKDEIDKLILEQGQYP